MTIKIDMLRYFVAVSQAGNLADAAERVGRTPSAVSMMIKQFEEHLGAPLFETERKNRLTPLGEFTLKKATRQLEHFGRTVSSIESFARADAGLVRIAAVPSVATSILPEAMHRFLEAHEDVQVQIRDMDTPGVLRNLELEDADLGYATMSEPIAGLHADLLFSDRFGVLCPADHPLAVMDRPPEWWDLAGYRFIENGVCGQIRDAEFQAVMNRSQIVVMNTSSILAAVRAGVGITVLSALVVRGFGDNLRFVKMADPDARRRVHSVRRAHSELSPAARAFHRHVQEVADEVCAAL